MGSNGNWFLVDFFSIIFFQDILEAYDERFSNPSTRKEIL